MRDFKYTPRSKLNINPGEVHVWLIFPSQVLRDIHRKLDSLSSDESGKAARFYFEKDRHLYETAHVSLRLILGLYVGIPPAEIKFVQTENGKPLQEKTQNHKNIAFNLSHTFDLVAIGVTKFPQIGIDVEFTGGKKIDPDLMTQISTGEEMKFYKNHAVDLQSKIFYKLWTRKEALLKACGMGLSIEPNQIYVEPEKTSPTLRLPADDFSTAPKFRLHDFQITDFHTGSVAVQTGSFKPVYRKLKF
jgi:4'-phosphopantetheinyl transferase